MNEEQKSNQETMMGEEEEILEFEFDDLTNEGSKEYASESDDEVIDLTDIVEEEEGQAEIGTATVELSDEVGKSFEITEDLGEPLGEEEAASLPELEEEPVEAEPTSAPQEELEIEPEVGISGMAEETVPATAEVKIDEERLEKLVTETVERVVEKVARQTMVEVAERLITEAIESLKESLKEVS